MATHSHLLDIVRTIVTAKENHILPIHTSPILPVLFYNGKDVVFELNGETRYLKCLPGIVEKLLSVDVYIFLQFRDKSIFYLKTTELSVGLVPLNEPGEMSISIERDGVVIESTLEKKSSNTTQYLVDTVNKSVLKFATRPEIRMIGRETSVAYCGKNIYVRYPGEMRIRMTLDGPVNKVDAITGPLQDDGVKMIIGALIQGRLEILYYTASTHSHRRYIDLYGKDVTHFKLLHVGVLYISNKCLRFVYYRDLFLFSKRRTVISYAVNRM